MVKRSGDLTAYTVWGITVVPVVVYIYEDDGAHSGLHTCKMLATGSGVNETLHILIFRLQKTDLQKFNY